MKPTLPLLLMALLPALALAQVPTADPTATRSATTVAPRRWCRRRRPRARSRRCCLAAAGAADQVHRSGPGRAHPGAEAGRQGL
jgi:hypothetical protein